MKHAAEWLKDSQQLTELIASATKKKPPEQGDLFNPKEPQPQPRPKPWPWR